MGLWIVQWCLPWWPRSPCGWQCTCALGAFSQDLHADTQDINFLWEFFFIGKDFTSQTDAWICMQEFLLLCLFLNPHLEHTYWLYDFEKNHSTSLVAIFRQDLIISEALPIPTLWDSWGIFFSGCAKYFMGIMCLVWHNKLAQVLDSGLG